MILGAQGRREHRGRKDGEPSQAVARARRRHPIGPGCLDEDAPQVRVARLGDAALVSRGAAGVLARHQAGEGHERGRAGEAPEVADLDEQHERGEGRDPPQRRQAPHRGLVPRPQRRFEQLALQPVASRLAQLERGDVLGEGAVQIGLVEALGADPGEVPAGPTFAVAPDAVVTQEELRKPVAGAQDVLAEVLAQAQQVAHRLVLSIGHAHRGEFAGAQQATELARVAAISLHAIAGSHRDQRGSDHLTGHAKPRQAALKLVPVRAGLVAAADQLRSTPAADQRPHGFGGVGDMLLIDGFLPGTEHRDLNARGGDIESDEGVRSTLGHGRRTSICGSLRAPARSTHEVMERRPLHLH